MDLHPKLGYTHQEILDRLRRVDDWLESLGISPRPNDRLHRGIEALKEAAAATRRKQETGLITPMWAMPAHVIGINEAMEFWRIYEAFKEQPNEVIAERVKRALSGPFDPRKAIPENSDGRNLTFELALAADWKMNGLDITLQEPDLLLKTRGFNFYVACKRPNWHHAIRSNIRRAKDQIDKSLTNAEPNSFGVTAISTSRLLTEAHGGILEAKSMADTNSIVQLQRRMLEREGIVRDGRIRVDLSDSRVCAVVFHLSMPMLVDEQFVLVGAYLSYETGARDKPCDVLHETMSSLFPAYRQSASTRRA
jgi:hypothetical protein